MFASFARQSPKGGRCWATLPRSNDSAQSEGLQEVEGRLRSHGPARSEAGLAERCLLRNTKSRNDVLILFAANNLARAKAFGASADLRAAMKNAGVVGKPELAVFADA